MLESPGSLAIVEGILGLATAFQCRAVAEGVETVEHGLISATGLSGSRRLRDRKTDAGARHACLDIHVET